MNEKRCYVRHRALVSLAALGFLGFSLGGGDTGFRDMPAEHWAAEAVTTLYEEGILVGYPDGTFGGERTLTRYEMAIIVARLVDYLRGLQILGAEGDALAPFMRIDDLETRVLAIERELELATTRLEFERLRERVAVLEAQVGLTPPPEVAALPEAVEEPEPTEDVVEPEPEVVELGEAPPVADPLAEIAEEPPVVEELLVEAPAVERRQLYFGIVPGFVSSAGTSAFGLQVGYDRILGALGFTGRLFYDGGVDELRLSADVQARFALGDAFDIYGGFGAGTLTRGTVRSALIEVPFGAEYFLRPEFGLFAQMVLGLPLDGTESGGYFTAGFNLRF